MNLEIAIVIIVIGIAVALFVSEKFSVDTVSILVMLLLIVSGILSVEEGFAGFSNPATITVGAMFVLSASVFKTGVLKGFGTLLTKLGKKNYLLCLFSLMIYSGTLSAFINDTAVVALFMPVVIQVARNTGIPPSKFLMPLSFGALLGGVCTLLGTSTNILVSYIAVKHGEQGFTMFELTPVGAYLFLAGVLYIAFIGVKFLPRREAGKGIISEHFDLGEYFTEIIILPQSEFAGRKVEDIIDEFDLKVLTITRPNKTVVQAHPSMDIQKNDKLKVLCDLEKLKKLSNDKGLEVKSEKKFEDIDPQKENIRLFEAVVPPNSILDGKTLKEINFKYVYGASVLAIRHRDGIIADKIGHAKLTSGDVLLLSANYDEVQSLRDSGDLMIVSEMESTKRKMKKLIPVLLIISGVILSATFEIAPIVVSAAVGCVLLIIFKCIEVHEAYKAIDWKVIFMLAGVLSMGTALEKTGAAQLIADLLINSIGDYGPYAVLSALFFLTFMSTNFMSNNASAALLAPIAIVTANSMGISSKPLLLAVTYAASLSFMTPVGYQTNTMIYGPGNYKFKDYLIIGTPLNIILWILASILIPYFFPFNP
jgi:di/tricarboxylate transporter